MLTLEETLAQQKDLEKLCADRPLKTKELFEPNALYGHDFIYKTYAGLPHDYSLKAVLPHSADLGSIAVWEEELKTDLPIIFAYREDLRDLYLHATKKVGKPKKIILSAFPLLYVAELTKDQPKPARQGTIFFPVHSTHQITIKMDFETLAEKLMQLDDQYKPITVCIYWRDFNLGHHLPFQKRGMEIVSVGHVFDPLFFFRFYHLCSMHHYASSNYISSGLVYAIKAGCSYFYLDSGITYSCEVDRQNPQDGPGKANTDLLRELELWFTLPTFSMTEEQIHFVDYTLGTAYLKSAQDLRRQIFEAELLYESLLFPPEKSLILQELKSFYPRCKHLLKQLIIRDSGGHG